MEKNQIIEKKILIIKRASGEVVKDIPAGAKPGEYREMQDFSEVPSQTDQSQINENNISLLMKKHTPDELAQYLAAKNLNRPVIEGHDFSQEPDFQEALNISYRITEQFNSLPDVVKYLFKGKPSEFLKFCENPQNIPQLEKWGLAKITQEILEPKNAKPNANEAPQKPESEKAPKS